MDVADLLAEWQTEEGPQLVQCIAVLQEALAQLPAKSCRVFVRGAVSLGLFLVEIIAETDFVEQLRMQHVHQLGILLLTRKLHRADELVDLGLQLEFEQRQCAVARSAPDDIVEVAQTLDDLAKVIEPIGCEAG